MELKAEQRVMFYIRNVELRATVFEDNAVVGEIELPQFLRMDDGRIRAFIKALAAEGGLTATPDMNAVYMFKIEVSLDHQRSHAPLVAFSFMWIYCIKQFRTPSHVLGYLANVYVMC